MSARICADPYLEMDGPILLLAGPGTGKTYQLSMRIQSLVNTHAVRPDEITVITFTKEAARSMRNKINERNKPEYIEPSKRPANIRTMHSLGFTIIAEHPGVVGLKPNVSVVADNVLRAALMRDAACLVGLSEKSASVAMSDKGKATAAASTESMNIIDAYNGILRACNAIDYDDQITLACEILESNAVALAKYRGAAKHLLIDEYQDINADQDRLIKLLSDGQTGGLFAVGDDDQSIYGFRGGEPKFIRNFQSEFAEAQILQLQISRRCLKNILDCAIALVKKFDPGRSAKADPIYMESEVGLVKVWNLPSHSREASHIARMIYAKTVEGLASDFFILVPNRLYVTPIAESLRSLGIAFEDGTAGRDDQAWEHLKIVKQWIENPRDLLTRHVVELVLESGATSIPSARVRLGEKKEARQNFCKEIADLWSPVIDGTSDLIASLELSSKTSGIIGEITTLLTNLKTSYLSGDLSEYMKVVGVSLNDFHDVNDFYACLRAIDSKTGSLANSDSSVRILTFQSSKGLEADCVFIVGLEENSIPRDSADANATAEEARLIFVAMTRAKKELHLLHSRTRTGASNFKPHNHGLKASVFVTSLPKSQVEEQYVKAQSARVRPIARRQVWKGPT